MTKLNVKMPLIDEHGFVTGRTWESNGKDVVMINSSQLKRISVNVGNSPPAHRLHFNDGTPDLDIMAEMAD